jgi:hypothetical protein
MNEDDEYPQLSEDEAVDAALKAVDRADDHSYDDGDLLEETIKRLKFDADQEKRNKARRAIQRRAKPGSTDAEGRLQPTLFDDIDLGSYAYEPSRLIRYRQDGKYRGIEQAQAKSFHKASEAARARKHATDADRWATRKETEAREQAKWEVAGLRDGREYQQLTFDLFVHEVGWWQEEPADPETGPEDGDSE